MSETASTVIAHAFRDYVDAPRWVEWRPEAGDKVPYIPGTGRKAKTNNPATWRAFSQCEGERLGWVFNGDDLGGIDLDACRDPNNGELAPWAVEVIDRFKSYTEVSPSGIGIHIFAAGVPPDFQFLTLKMPGELIGKKQPQTEAFTSKGFLTVTGDKLPDAPNEITAAPEAWAWLQRWSGPSQTTAAPDNRGEAHANDWLSRYKEQIASEPHGTRNKLINTAAFHLATMAARGWIGETRISDELMAAADAALYQAKRGGRDRVVVASAPAIDEAAIPATQSGAGWS